MFLKAALSVLFTLMLACKGLRLTLFRDFERPTLLALLDFDLDLLSYFFRLIKSVSLWFNLLRPSRYSLGQFLLLNSTLTDLDKFTDFFLSFDPFRRLSHFF